MSYVIKIIGSVLLLMSVLALTREYKKFLEKRLGICRGFTELLLHVRRKIDSYLTPASQLLDGFECKALADEGYMKKAHEVGISEAFFSLEKAIPMESSERVILESFFADFGKDYKDGTLRSLDIAIAGLRECIEKLCAENERSLKLVCTLAVAAALGLIILLI